MLFEGVIEIPRSGNLDDDDDDALRNIIIIAITAFGLFHLRWFR